MTTREELGARLSHARLDARLRGERVAYSRLSRRLSAEYGIEFSDEAIRQIHLGQGPEPDMIRVEVVCALCRIYGVNVEDVSSVVASRAAKLRIALGEDNRTVERRANASSACMGRAAA